MHAWRAAMILGLLLAGACSAGSSVGAGASDPARGAAGEPGAGLAAGAPVAPAFRLGDSVVPLAYALHIEADPRDPGYQGQVSIDVRLTRPARTIWMHAEGLAMDSVRVEPAQPAGATPVAATAHAADQAAPGLVRLELGRPVPAGEARIVIGFQGQYGDRVGVFRQAVDGDQYVFTDFEPIDARRGFPSFDEPRFKAPWRISLTVPTGMHGLSNMPATRSEPLPGGKTRIHFAPTRPLPTYLVALAVGPFDIVDGPTEPVPLRVVVPRGMAAWAEEALEVAPPLLRIVQDYFGTPVPFPKLDLLSVPQLSGAMENPGLITVASHILLADPDNPSIPQRRLLAMVCAHEFAHLWLGDLVTPADWRDLWLNEGFATWLADKALLAWRPERRPELDQVAARHEAMLADQAPDARALRQPVHGREALAGIFDTITYKKGGAVVAMLEAWIGEAGFRRALRGYVATHANGNAGAGDLIDALNAVAAREVRGPLHGFLHLPGFPLVRAELACEQDGGEASALVTLSQRRYLPMAGDRPGDDALWQVPVCVRHDDGRGAAAETCVLLDAPEERVALDTEACPAWLVPNAHAHGYYRYAMPAAQLAAAARAPLHGREALDLAHGLRALARSGDLEADDALTLAGILATRPERHVIEAIIELFEEVQPWLAGEQAGRFRAHVRMLLGPRARALGFAPRPGESEEETLLRPRLVGFVGRAGRDPWIVRGARDRADAWLRTGHGIAPGMIETTVRIAAASGDAGLFQRMERALLAAGPEDETRAHVLAAALASFEDPALVDRALDLVRNPSLALVHRHRLLAGLLERADALPRVLAALEAHQDQLAESRAGQIILLTPLLGAPLCSDDALGRAQALVARLVQAGSIAPEVLDQHRPRVQHATRTCARIRDFQAGHVAEFYR